MVTATNITTGNQGASATPPCLDQRPIATRGPETKLRGHMGIRRSYGKNKKSNRPTEAATVERQDILRRTANVRSRFDSTRSTHKPPGPAPGK